MAGEDPAVTYSEAFRSAVAAAFSKLGITDAPIIERPRSGIADLCLVCFPFASRLKERPEVFAERVMALIPPTDLFTMEVSGGYLNCAFDLKTYAVDCASYLWARGEGLGKNTKRPGKVIVEHTSANPNGPFHVGRARNPMIGDTLVRMLRADGHEVEAEYWVNDMGKQVMILAWGVANIREEDLPPPEREKEDHRLVRFYQEANRRMESDPSVEAAINGMLLNYEEAVSDRDWDRTISGPGAPPIRAVDIKDLCRKVLDGMSASLARLNVRLDSFVYESEVVEDGSLTGVVSGLMKSPLCRDEGGAKFLDLSDLIKGGGEEDGFKKRFVFTRSDGSALYTTRDLAYHLSKLGRCDVAVNVLGEDHKFQSLMLDLALKELGSKKRPEALFYSFVSLPEGKMSTRKGRVVYLDDLIDEAVERAKGEVEKRRGDLSDEQVDMISRMVGVGALRFNFIKVQPEKRIVFKWEDALNFEGATAPFVQYSHARACSIIGKGDVSLLKGDIDWGTLVEPSELDLVRTISYIHEMVRKGAEERKMHLLASYLVEVASRFNDFYRDCPVLSEKEPERAKARLALVELSRRALSKGLSLLGIEAPCSM